MKTVSAGSFFCSEQKKSSSKGEKEQTQTANKNGSDDASKNISVNNTDSKDPIIGLRSPTKKDKEVNRVKDKSSKKELLTEKVSRSNEKEISSSKSVPVHNL